MFTSATIIWNFYEIIHEPERELALARSEMEMPRKIFIQLYICTTNLQPGCNLILLIPPPSPVLSLFLSVQPNLPLF